MHRVILLIITAVLCAAAFLVFLSLKPQHTAEGIQAEKIRPYLRNGDVICRRGNRIWSSWFSAMSPEDKRFSHLGIVRVNSGGVSVINAEGLAIQGKDQVNEVSLEDFLDIALAVGIYRARDIEGDRIAETAALFIGRSFDWQFNMDEEDTLYCTELLYAVIRRLAPEVQLKTVFQKELAKNIIPLDACTRSEHFTEVFYIAAAHPDTARAEGNTTETIPPHICRRLAAERPGAFWNTYQTAFRICLFFSYVPVFCFYSMHT
jgi:hypothetical protein